MEIGIFVFGTGAFYVFWLAFIVVIAVLATFSELLFWGWATVLELAAVVLLGYFGIFNLYTFAVTYPMALLGKAVIYVGCGLVWSTFKWWRRCAVKRDEYDDAKASFLKSYNASEFTNELRVAWTKRNRQSYHSVATFLDWRQHKEELITWAYLWPFSLIANIFSNWIRGLFTFLYRRMGGIYDVISKSVWKGVSDDFLEEVPTDSSVK